EARHALTRLKQVAGGAIPPPQHFPMVHFDSASTPAMTETRPAVRHEPAEPTEPTEPDEPAMPYPQQFIDNEPPFEPSFVDSMAVQLGFNEPEQKVSANSFTPLSPWISSTHDSAVVIETDSEDEDVHDEAEPPPAPRVGGVGPHGVGSWLTAAAVPAVFMRLSMCFIGAAAGSGLYSETAPQSVVPGGCLYYQNGTVDFADSVFLDFGTSDFNTIFAVWTLV
ncbi:hypothetical protein CYMTET_35033, partial [Cymbomonas tetramitiformis]